LTALKHGYLSVILGTAQTLSGFVQRLSTLMHPVGTVLITTSSTNPGDYLGGTWSQIAAGRTILGEGGAYTAGDTDGSKDAVAIDHGHADTFAVASNGAHTHDVHIPGQDTTGSYSGTVGWNHTGNDRVFSDAAQSDGSHSHTLNGAVTDAGVDGTDLNMMPYLVTYIWERTA